MAKQDVLDAINATIVENGQKGITAQSLNNVLTMMAENAGEGGGSGDGALRVIVPELLMFGLEIVGMGELTPASWEEIKLVFEADGLDISEYDAVINASFEHNANVAQQILEKAKAGQGVSIVLDQTPYYPAAINCGMQMSPEMALMIESYIMGGAQPAGLFVSYIKPTLEGEPMFDGEQFLCYLAPTGHLVAPGIENYPSYVLIQLNLDGSLIFIINEEEPSSGSGVVTFYVTDREDLPNEYKEKNVKAYSAFESGSLVTLQLYTAGAIRSTITPFTTSKESDAIILGLLQEGDNGLTVLPYVINADGSVNLLQ